MIGNSRAVVCSLLLLAFFASTVEVHAWPFSDFYRVRDIEKLTISYDREQDMRVGSQIPIQVNAHLKDGKIKEFTKWDKAAISVQGGTWDGSQLVVSSALEDVADHQLEISISLTSNPRISASETIVLNYRGLTHANYDGLPGADGTNRGNSRGGFLSRNGREGRDGGPGADGESAPHVDVYIRREPGSVHGNQLVRATALARDHHMPTQEFLFNAVGGSFYLSADGGSGGSGGNGGDGGNGRDATEKKNPGNGGDGGAGGDGGDGGSGGELTIFIHPDCRDLYESGAIKFSVAGRPGGEVGVPGTGGSGGEGGQSRRRFGVNYETSARDGNAGSVGSRGDHGEVGSISVSIEERSSFALPEPLPPGDFDPDEALELVFPGLETKGTTLLWEVPKAETVPARAKPSWDSVAVKILDSMAFRQGDSERNFLVFQSVPAGEEFTCRGCSPDLGAATFTNTNEGWRLDALNCVMAKAGSNGEAPTPVLVQLGPERYGLTFSSMGVGQGSTFAVDSFFLEVGPSVQEVIEVDTYADNLGNCGCLSEDCGPDDPDSLPMVECYERVAEVEFVSGKNSELFDLKVTEIDRRDDTFRNVTLYSYADGMYREASP